MQQRNLDIRREHFKFKELKGNKNGRAGFDVGQV